MAAKGPTAQGLLGLQVGDVAEAARPGAGVKPLPKCPYCGAEGYYITVETRTRLSMRIGGGFLVPTEQGVFPTHLTADCPNRGLSDEESVRRLASVINTIWEDPEGAARNLAVLRAQQIVAGVQR